MSLVSGITRSNFWIKMRSWEYWPFGILQFPLFIYWLWLSLKARSLVFFSASNPSIEMGGMFGESKFDILSKIPGRYVPKMALVELPATGADVLRIMREQGLSFPVICKPDIGERGFLVRKICDQASLDAYLREIRVSFIVQELVDLPQEFGVFYTRFPWEPKGRVTSVVMKEMLSVTGDGRRTLRELILDYDRSKLQWEKLRFTFRDRLQEILPEGQKLELVSIGNHVLGTKFLDGTHLINEKLNETFDSISSQIEGFYFGRYDLRCSTIDDLYSGNIRILELNGCGAEPAHIYEPGYSIVKAMRTLLTHWKNIYLIASANHRAGIPYTSFRDAYRAYKRFKQATSP